jgi:hypothetical protein
VKFWISILAAAAIVALSASAAFATVPWDTNSGGAPIGARVAGKQDLGVGKVAPTTKETKLTAQNRALKAKNRDLAAKIKAIAAEAKYQADRNLALSNYIGQLNQRLMQYEGTGPKSEPVDPDQECKEYSVCTPEQDCRIWGNGCPIAQPMTESVDAAPQNETEGGSQS